MVHGFVLFSVSPIPVYHHRIWYFPVMGGVKRESGVRGGDMFLTKGGISKQGDEERKGADTPFRTMDNYTCFSYEGASK